MTLSQSEKAKRFAALHQQPGTFVIANACDDGSASLLALNLERAGKQAHR